MDKYPFLRQAHNNLDLKYAMLCKSIWKKNCIFRLTVKTVLKWYQIYFYSINFDRIVKKRKSRRYFLRSFFLFSWYVDQHCSIEFISSGINHYTEIISNCYNFFEKCLCMYLMVCSDQINMYGFLKLRLLRKNKRISVKILFSILRKTF